MEGKTIWKAVPGYEGIYEVSENGEVRRVDGQYGAFIVPSKTNSGYLQVYLRKPRIKRKHLYIHRLVAEAFIANPNNYDTVNHKDGNKMNNSTTNLEWVTRSQNNYHAYHVLNLNMGGRKTPVVCVETGEVFRSIADAARKTGAKCISYCVNGKCLSSGGLHWKRA